jgi:hypothetical protein
MQPDKRGRGDAPRPAEEAFTADTSGRTLRLACLAGLWLLAGCTANGPEEPPLFTAGDRGPAVLAFYEDTSAVQLASSTRVGEATMVQFTSFGGGCVAKDTTEADLAGLSAEVRPYRREPARLPANTACSAELRLDQNVVQLRFAEPGRAHVRIVGLARPGDHPFVLERDLQVTP